MAREEMISTYDNNPRTAEKIRRILNGRELKSDFAGIEKSEAVKIIKLQTGCDEATARMVYIAGRDGSVDDVVEV